MESNVKAAEDVELWTCVSGEGTPTIVLNGGPGMADYLAPMVEPLDGIIMAHRYEQRGCGRSSIGDLTLEAFVADIEALREHWGFEKWLVLGHSWGVDLALAYALAHPERARALIGLSGGRVHNDRDWHSTYEQKRDLEVHPPSASPPDLNVNKALNTEWRNFCKSPHLLRELADLTVPALFLYGEQDIRPPWPTQQIAALLPNARYLATPDGDHNFWQTQSVWMRDAIVGFLDELSV